MKFTEFKFGNELQEGLDMMGFEEATPIQIQAIPTIQKGKDLIACAPPLLRIVGKLLKRLNAPKNIA